MNFIDSLLGKKKEDPPGDGNGALVRAMQEIASHDNLENRKTLYGALLGSMLLVPVPEIPAGLTPGLQTGKNEVQIRLTVLTDRNRVKISPPHLQTSRR